MIKKTRLALSTLTKACYIYVLENKTTDYVIISIDILSSKVETPAEGA